MFEGDWNFATKRPTKINTKFENDESTQTKSTADLLPVYIAPSGPLNSQDTIRDTLCWSIASAKKRVVIATPYFVPNETLINILGLAAVREQKYK